MSRPRRRQPVSERKLAENQVAFRSINQRVPQSFDELKRIAKEEDQLNLVSIPTGILFFRCECSDETCERKVPMKLKTYQDIHRQPDEFCVAIGHVVTEVEDVIETTDEYQVVKKKNMPPQTANGFNPTDIRFN